MIIALEGLDGTGKTYYGTRAAAALDCKYVHTPSDFHLELIKNKEINNSLVVEFFMYLTSCGYAVGSNTASNLIIDRYWFSSVVSYGYKSEIPIEAVKTYFEMAASLLGMPTLYIFLFADTGIRKRRLATRNESINSSEHDTYWMNCVEEFAKWASEKIILRIDTSKWDSDMSPTHLKTKIIEKFRYEEALERF